MTQQATINSPHWWDNYFISEWEKHDGCSQTRAFMDTLISALPEIDRHALRAGCRTILDWGCAFGQGTDLLAQTFPESHVVGCDISPRAISEARARISTAEFLLAPFGQPAGELQGRFDAIFNSNCLEHFEAPVAVLTRLLERTNLVHISLVPYREDPLSEYHLTRFDETTFPERIGDFQRIASTPIEIDPHFWPSGQQLLTVYASSAYMEIRSRSAASLRERDKWDRYYSSHAPQPVDPATTAFNLEFVNYVRGFLPERASTLEAGCGGGSQSLELARAGYAVTLLDFSTESLRHARSLFSDAGLEAAYVNDDAFSLAQPQYDLVFNAGVLEHYDLVEQARFLRGMASRSRGYVLALVPNRDCYWYWVWRTQRGAAGQWPFGAEVPRSTLREAFERAGLEYCGETYLGEGWTTTFIDECEGLSSDAKGLLKSVHAAGLVGKSARTYLVAALGKVAPVSQPNVPDPGPAAFQSKEISDEYRAILADALAMRLGAESKVAASDRLAGEIESLKARLLELSDWGRDLSTRFAVSEFERNRLGDEARLRESTIEAQVQHLAAMRRDLELAATELSSEKQRREAAQTLLDQTLSRLASTDAARTQLAIALAESLRAKSAPLHVARALAKLAFKIYHRIPLPSRVRATLSKVLRRLIGVRWLALLTPFTDGVTSHAPAIPDATVDSAPTYPRPLTRKSNTRLDVFFFSIIDWHFRIQRPQHLARALSRNVARCFYLSNHFNDSAEPGFSAEALDDHGELFQIRLNVAGAPPIYFSPLDAPLRGQLLESLRMLLLWTESARTAAVLQHPFWLDAAECLPNCTLIYDCMDFHEGFGNVQPKMLDLERQALHRSDGLIVTSQWLADRYRAENQQLSIIRNAVDYEFFAKHPEVVYLDPQARRVIGYYGAIADWFDVSLVEKIATRFPNAAVVLIGRDTIRAEQKLARHPNVTFIGEVAYETLPYYLYGFDVCILPFLITELTLATNPVKVYEYLAAGKPVVSVDLPELREFSGNVCVGRTHDEFNDQIAAVLQEERPDARASARRAFASEQTWAQRANDLFQRIEGTALPRVSVIVLTFNNLELTQRCLHSLVSASDYPALELIVVDNASTDGTQEWLKVWAADQPNASVLLNNRNLGFAAGNNIGLARATGEYLVILNNDTIVTRGWLRTLLRHFLKRPTLGLLGPVTNNIGNEARIPTTYTSIDAMSEEAKRYTLAHSGTLYLTQNIAFFCAMLPRAVYDRVGSLSEDYGLGFFEDDDYCHRVKANGFDVGIADDVFVHHHLSASFGKLDNRDRDQLFERNKSIFEKKWGKWKPHKYRGT